MSTTINSEEKGTQVSATEEILDNYDQEVASILRAEQAKVNRKLQGTRNDHHASIQAIEKEAHEMLQQAHREGEVHVVERHRKTAGIFFVQNGKAMMWSEGAVTEIEIPVISNGSKVQAVRASDWILSDLKLKSGEEAQASVFYSFQDRDKVHTQRNLATLVKKVATGDYYLLDAWTEIGNELEDDLFNTSNGWHGEGFNKSIFGSWIENPKGKNKHSFLSSVTSEMDSPWRNVITVTAAPNDGLHVYLIRKNTIQLLQIKKNQPNVGKNDLSLLLAEKHLDTPVALAVNTAHNSLLIQDAGTRTIGVHLLDSEKKQVWRSFNRDSQITLPPGVFQLDTTWTLSCLAKRNCRQPLWNDPPIYTGPFKVWVEKESGLLKLQYEVDGKQQAFTSPENMPLTSRRFSDWFLFTMQRDGNIIRFFIDGELFWTHESTNFPSLRQKKVLFSLTGFFLCELRVWRTIRTEEELKRYKRSWLPHSAYHGLSGYWHLQVIGKDKTGLTLNTFDAAGKINGIIQEPDLSGNGHHLPTWRGKGEVGDLNRETVTEFVTNGPFEVVMPIYELNAVHQGVEIDVYAGRIYWIDETGDFCRGQRVMIMGSVLGHLPPVPLFRVDSVESFSVLSRTTAPFNELIIAHAARRKAMQDHLLSIHQQHQEAHEAVQNAHDEFSKSLDASPPLKGSNNVNEYATVHAEWLAELDRIANEEERALRIASARRNRAIAQAQEMTDAAQRRVIAHRRKRE